MMLFNAFLKLVDKEEWIRLGAFSAEDQYQGSEIAQRMIALYLLDNEGAVDERAELRGADSGKVFVSWNPVREEKH